MGHWLETPYSTEAAKNDFMYFKNLEVCKKANETAALELSKKFLAQSWYLSPKLIGFSLFSNKVSVDTKQVIVRNLETGCEWNVR